jgi:hypothetical protein
MTILKMRHSFGIEFVYLYIWMTFKNWFSLTRILTVYFMFAGAPVFASSLACLKFYAGRIVATKGIEVEMQPIRANLERQDVSPLEEWMRSSESREVSDFRRMRLGTLFSLYGLDELTGERIEHLLPKIVTEHAEFKRRLNPVRLPLPEFARKNPDDWLPSQHQEYNELLEQEALRRLPFLVERHGQQYKIKDFDRLSGTNLINTLRFLFDITGVDSESLVLEKKPEAWADKTEPSDLLIPKRVVIETRNGKSAGLEFPMSGAVHTEKEIKDYIKNLWVRLGIFERGETDLLEQAGNETIIHLHWVPNIKSAPKQLRKDLYQNQKNLFGDLNDSAMLDQYTQLARTIKVNRDGHVNSESAETAFQSFTKFLKQNPIMNLTRSAFRRVVSTQDGIYEQNREYRDGNMDPNFSNELKLLRYGLRGKYNQPTLGMNRPVPIVGIEFRNDGNFTNTTQKVQRAEMRFHEDIPDGPRGIEDDPTLIRRQAQSLGIDLRIVGAVTESIRSGDPQLKSSPWMPRTIAATLLIPMTRWEIHPLYLQRLKLMTPSQKSDVEKRFADARTRYQKNVNLHVKQFYETSDARTFQLNIFTELMVFLKDATLSSVMNGI